MTSWDEPGQGEPGPAWGASYSSGQMGTQAQAPQPGSAPAVGAPIGPGPAARYQVPARFGGPYAQPAVQWAPYTPYGAAQPASTSGNGMAIASLVLGITSIVFCWLGALTLAQVVLAIVFGCIGISRANNGAPDKGQAVAGLVLGLVGLGAYLVLGAITLGVMWLI